MNRFVKVQGRWFVDVQGPAKSGDVVTIMRRDGVERRIRLQHRYGELWSIYDDTKYDAMEECREVFHANH